MDAVLDQLLTVEVEIVSCTILNLVPERLEVLGENLLVEGDLALVVVVLYNQPARNLQAYGADRIGRFVETSRKVQRFGVKIEFELVLHLSTGIDVSDRPEVLVQLLGLLLSKILWLTVRVR